MPRHLAQALLFRQPITVSAAPVRMARLPGISMPSNLREGQTQEVARNRLRYSWRHSGQRMQLMNSKLCAQHATHKPVLGPLGRLSVVACTALSTCTSNVCTHR